MALNEHQAAEQASVNAMLGHLHGVVAVATSDIPMLGSNGATEAPQIYADLQSAIAPLLARLEEAKKIIADLAA